jgi:hypothetical protein
MTKSLGFWTGMFVAAALFNFAIGIPLMLARQWAFELAFTSGSAANAGVAPDLWADFGYCVTLIGVGYLIVARDVASNRGLVWLGIFAKLFDVVVLTWRFFLGMTRPIVLLPASIDALFVVLFVCFLIAVPGSNHRAPG